MFTASSGLKAHQILLDVTANNLANVNTIGYKGSRAAFQDSLTQIQGVGAASSPGFGGSNSKQVGLGVTVGSIANQMGAGSFQVTGSTLDVAIQGDGWIRVGNGTPTSGNPTAGAPAGASINYTRSGNFTTNDKGYLITTDGFYVMGKVATDTAGTGGVADCYIEIPQGATDVAIAPDGAVSFIPPAGYTQPAALPAIGADGRAIAGYLSVSTFSNTPGLQRITNNRWSATAQSGTEQAGTPGGQYGQAIAGVLEMSNVDMASEFTTMISAQRGFQANSRVISTTDQMLQDLVSLVR
ncbi:MAG: flagellar hook-basal body complex protein [Solirubrobacteraceae bacterium]|nr:flagellar hook-basal body complex protein [Solirubrobacteraceae bacterium]